MKFVTMHGHINVKYADMTSAATALDDVTAEHDSRAVALL
jgi:hypothetical protein